MARAAMTLSRAAKGKARALSQGHCIALMQTPARQELVMSTSPAMSPVPARSQSLRVAGALVVIGALGFVIVFSALAALFGYPDVLDRPASEVLPALIAGGATLKAWWILYAVLPLTLSAAALLAHGQLANLGRRARLFTASGVAAGLAMALGLLRWSTLQWSLGESWLAADGSSRAAIEAVSDASNRMLGNGLGEVVGETLLGLWLLGAGLALHAAFKRATSRGLGAHAIQSVASVTLLLAGALLVAAWRFAWPALEAVTAVTNVLLPVGLSALGVTWFVARLPVIAERTADDVEPVALSATSSFLRGAVAVIAVAIAVVSASPSRAEPAPETAPAATPRVGMPKRELMLHGFRAPSMGVELREDWIGFHVGFYPTILDTGADGKGRTTWFAKTGVTFYPWQFDAGSGRPSGIYLGLALVQGLDNDWDASKSATTGSGGFFDAGFRWAAFKGFDLRIGAGALVGFDGRVEVNFTPGFSWGIPL